MDHIIEYFFSILCHRIPLRSYLYNGDIYLCARCTGLYTGFLITFSIFFYFLYRKYIFVLSSKKLIFLTSLLIFPTVLEKTILAFFPKKLFNKDILFFNGLLLGQCFAMIGIVFWEKLKNNKKKLARAEKNFNLYLWIGGLSIIFYLIIPKINYLAIIVPLLVAVTIFYFLNLSLVMAIIEILESKQKDKNNNILLLLPYILLMMLTEIAIIKGLKK